MKKVFCLFFAFCLILIVACEGHVHDYKGEVTQFPSCNENGELILKCSCGHTKTDIIPKLNHIVDTGTIVNATCQEDGSINYKCQLCGVSMGVEVIHSEGHSWNNGSVTVSPTCTADGVSTYTCTNCFQTKNENIPALGHSWNIGFVTKQATCTTDGILTYTCATCHQTKNELIHSWGHNWNEGEITTNPTCLNDGQITYTCSVCLGTRVETIEKLGHNWETISLYDSVCTHCDEHTALNSQVGGYVFYDCDADNEIGNADGLESSICGWRYLVAAPSNLRVINGIPSVDSAAPGYMEADFEFGFGDYRIEGRGENSVYVNGTLTYNASDCTLTGIGTGETNTQKLVDAMGDSAYGWFAGTSSVYAANLCNELEYDGFNDWFLPSKEELNCIYNVLYRNNKGDLDRTYYWSSSELNYDPFTEFEEEHSILRVLSEFAFYQSFYDGMQHFNTRGAGNSIRPIRAF